MKNKTNQNTKTHFFITVPFIILTLWQGGFTGLIWCLAGVCFSVFLILRPFVFPSKTVMPALAGLIVAYIVSTLLAGSHTEGWMGVIKITVVVLLIIILQSRTPNTDEIAFFAGITVAMAGLLSYSGLLPLPGMTVGGRLYGVFQYANVTALFLAVCAFLTRLSEKRASMAVIMETALILTQSLGGLAVYAAGWIIYRIVRKDFKLSLHLGGFMLSAIMAAGILGVVLYTLVPYFAVIIPIAYITAQKPIQKTIENISRKKWFAVSFIIIAGLAAAGFFALRGTRPLLTFLERAVHITDSFRVMLAYPLGLGSGNWSFHMREYQSAWYDATLPHCGYIQIGLSGGFLALGCVIFLIGFWLKKQKTGKYTVAALMILVHALQDISFLFLTVILLLAMCMRSALPEGALSTAVSHKRRKPIAILFAAVAIACLTLCVPELQKNHAGWIARGGRYEEAAAELENGVLLSNDTQALIMRITYAAQSGKLAELDKAFQSMKNPNSEALHWQALYYIERGEYTAAAETALLCAEKSPYWEEGYELLDEIIPRLAAEDREEYRRQKEMLRETARQNAHPFAKFIIRGE
ncbi:MAG TPA: hypothetical protein DEQ02_04810 [Ruminococcaceae bacterium]|nr:hypothetical protein [Oscillospiraceae bacterium]